MAEGFATASRDEWIDRAAGRDIALAPLLSPEEAALHAQTEARQMVREEHGIRQVGVTPKLSENPGDIGSAPARPGQHSVSILVELGYAEAEIEELIRVGVTQLAGAVD